MPRTHTLALSPSLPRSIGTSTGNSAVWAFGNLSVPVLSVLALPGLLRKYDTAKGGLLCGWSVTPQLTVGSLPLAAL